MILADTNVLLRLLHPSHHHFGLAENALTSLRLRGEEFCIAPQNLIEFWAVATRPRNENGLGMSVDQVAKEMSGLRQFFHLLPYASEVSEVWKRIVIDYAVIGKQTHDAHIVAIMQINRVSSILTFNASHFSRFPDITAINPSEL